jgi:hypothetical protein
MSYLQRHPKSGVYRFRRAVPPKLRKALGGKHEIKKSLGTKNVNEAKRKAMEYAAEVDRLFASVRSGVNITLADAEAIAAAWKADDRAQ